MYRLMESDLSIIEIAGEDDSLLQQIPANEIAAVNTSNYFSCSPLQIFRPQRSAEASRLRPTEDLKSNWDADKPTCSSPGDGSNKENVNENKFGVPKLCVEPQQMKKRKKGGGYNLRQSLAWDRAFFTEEGVLNPLELSVVSGNFDKFSGEALSVINEEATKSVSDDLDYPNDSEELQALEGKLFKELPVSTSNGGKSIGGCTQPKQDSSTCDNEAPARAVRRKVLSVHDANRSGSKRGGFSRPLSSASQKRQANANTKVVSRDAKLPKIPVSKPAPCLLNTTTKSASLSTSHLKRNHIAQPGSTVPKSAGLKGSSSKFISAQNNAKLRPDCASFSVKSSVLHARRNVVPTPQANPPLEINSSGNLQPQSVTKVNSSLKVIPDIKLPAVSANREHPSIAGYSGSNKTAVSLPQNARHIGGNLQYAQPQTTKPSGLRMPSPSLGLFSQPKASASQRNQICNLLKSSVPNYQKFHASNSIHAPRPLHESGKISRVVNDIQTGDITALTLSARCSISSAAKPVLPETVKLNVEVDNFNKSELKFPCAPKSSEVIKNNILDCVDKKYHEHAEPQNFEIPRKEDSELQINDHKLLLQSASSKMENSHTSSQQNLAVQVKGVCGTDGITEHQFVEEKQDNMSVTNQHDTSESESRDTINCSKPSTSVVSDGQLVNMFDAREQSGEQVNLTKCCTHEPDLISLVENKKQRANDDILFKKSFFEESRNYVNGNIVDPKVQDSSTSTLESCQHPSQCTKKSGKDAIGADEMIKKSHEQDALMPCSNGNLLVESCRKNLSTCSRYLMIADDVHEQSGEQEPQNPIVELSHAEDAPAVSVEVKPSFENYKCVIDTPLMHEVKFNGEVTSMEFDSSLRVSNDQTTFEVTTLNSIITNFHPESRDSSGSELEDPHSTSLFGPAVHVESVCGTEKMVEYQHMEETEYKSPVKNQAVITKAQCGDTIDGSNQVASVLQNNWLSCMHVVNGPSEEQAQLIKCCTSEADQISNNENQKLQTEDSTSSESSQKYERCVTDVGPKICGYNGSELESSDGPSQLKYIVQGEEEGSRIDSTTKKLNEGDAGGHTIDSDLLVERCRSNLSSAVQNLYVVGSDLINEQSGEQVKLQIPCLVVEQSSQDKHGLCPNNYSLLSNGTSSNESWEENVSESSDYVVPEQSHLQESVLEISTTVVQLPLGIPDGFDVGKMAKNLNAEEALPDSGDFKSSLEGHEYPTDTQFRPGIELNSQATSLESDSSLKQGKEQSTDAVTNCSFQVFHSSSNESGLSLQHVQSLPSGSIQHCMELNGLKSYTLLEEAATKICQDSNSASSKLQHQLDDTMCSTENKKSENDMKRDAPVKKPPLGAVPFSDEWLTAIEAAGEEILTLKSGAVQNSPPDKSQPEPSPWSPVKKKVNQEIGPFDCTKKLTSIPPANSN